MIGDGSVDITSVLHVTEDRGRQDQGAGLIATNDLSSTERGAGLTEYAMLIAFIVLVCIAAIALVGGSTAEPFSSVLSGFS